MLTSNTAHAAKNVESEMKLDGVSGGLKSFAVAAPQSHELLLCGWKTGYR